MAFHTIVVEIPDSVDPAVAEAKLTDEIERASLITNLHTVTSANVIEYHREKITEGD